MAMLDLARKIERYRVATLVDWGCYAGALVVGTGAHLALHHQHLEELRFADLDMSTLKLTYSIQIAALWIGVLLILGLVRVRIVLRGIRRDMLEREVRSAVTAEPGAAFEIGRAKPVACPQCNQELGLPPGFRHHQVKCASCGHVFRVHPAGRRGNRPTPAEPSQVP